ncbi:hypothetical protein PVAR5_5166 [Paecilomyces variotii No. 5]|uniref:Uncharacterized protein n=1 Tax=Byssochlamys spectabilis (strain No. 5 / NBRC 109023) TaxID=1356009 RepID=V5I1F3_BYSSN|nr:hypothetical protein PVAR5_5166 [Paecilomyces variotii No. 5]
MASSRPPLRGSCKDETKGLANSSNSTSGWTFFPPLPNTGETDIPNPVSHSAATTQLQPERDNIQQRRHAEVKNRPANARLTDQTSSPVTFPTVDKRPTNIQTSARANEDSHKHSQGLGIHPGELNRDTAGKCRMDDLPQAQKSCSEARNTSQHKTQNPAFSRGHQSPSPELPRISSGPSLAQSFESVLPQDLATQLTHSSMQDHTALDGPDPFSKREAHPAWEQSAESFSDLSLGYLSKERASSIGDGATSLPTIPEAPYEDIRKTTEQTDHIVYGNTRRNSRQVIGQTFVPTDAAHINMPKQKLEDSPISKSESYYRSDSRSSSQTYSSSASERYTDESSSFISQSAGPKPCLDSQSESISSTYPLGDARRSGHLEDKCKDPVYPKRGSGPSYVENMTSHHIPQIQAQKPPNSAKPQPAHIPSQTTTQTQSKPADNAPVSHLRKDLLPPWAITQAEVRRSDDAERAGRPRDSK